MDYGAMAPWQATVIGKKGAALRSGVSLDSPACGDLPAGATVVVDGRGMTADGRARYRLRAPSVGWCSARMLSPPDAAPLLADVAARNRAREAASWRPTAPPERDDAPSPSMLEDAGPPPSPPSSATESSDASDGSLSSDDVDDEALEDVALRSDARRGLLAYADADATARAAREKLWAGDVGGAARLARASTSAKCLRVAADARIAKDALAEADARFKAAVAASAGPDVLEALLERTETYRGLCPRCSVGAGLELAVLTKLGWHDAAAAALEGMLDARGGGETFVEASKDVPGRARAMAERLPAAHGAGYFESLKATLRFEDAATTLRGMEAAGAVGSDAAAPALAELGVLRALYRDALAAKAAKKPRARHKALEACVARAPDHVRLLCELSEAALLVGATPRAAEAAGLAVGAAPTHAGARVALAEALRALGDADAAVAEYETALRFERSPAACARVFGRLRAVRGDKAGNAFFRAATGADGPPPPAFDDDALDADVAAAITFFLDGGDTLYSVLRAPSVATDADLRRAYRKLALAHHPDRAAGRAADAASAADAMARINAAYEILCDEPKRNAYDDALAAVARQRRAAHGA